MLWNVFYGKSLFVLAKTNIQNIWVMRLLNSGYKHSCFALYHHAVTGERQQLDPDPNHDVNLTDCNIKCIHALRVPYYEKHIFSGAYIYKLVLPWPTNSQNEESK